MCKFVFNGYEAIMIFSQVSIVLQCSRTRKLGLLISVCDWQNHDGFISNFLMGVIDYNVVLKPNEYCLGDLAEVGKSGSMGSFVDFHNRPILLA